ncbi:MAG: response regulator [Leptospiraceae bacterium]|nr:response regulator [Leptospiraceae bacterium]MCB1302880.1 response regulator [Leptospiraceae bacterium]
MDLLIIDPDQGIQEYYRNTLEAEFRGIQVTFVSTSKEAEPLLGSRDFDLILTETDLDTPFFPFLDGLVRVGPPVIVVSRDETERLAVESIRYGAIDFISKKNLKLGIFSSILARALLDGQRWSEIRKFAVTKPPYPEVRKHTDLILASIDKEREERDRLEAAHKMAGGMKNLKEGQTYEILFMYANIRFTEGTYSQMDDWQMQQILTRWKKILNRIPESYGGQVWIQKKDAIVAAFDGHDILPGFLAALEMNARVYLLSGELPIERAGISIALCSGQTVYTSEMGSLVSEALNFSAHLSMRDQVFQGIFIPGEIYEHLNGRSRKFFFREDSAFEGRTIYRFERIG